MAQYCGSARRDAVRRPPRYVRLPSGQRYLPPMSACGTEGECAATRRCGSFMGQLRLAELVGGMPLRTCHSPTRSYLAVGGGSLANLGRASGPRLFLSVHRSVWAMLRLRSHSRTSKRSGPSSCRLELSGIGNAPHSMRGNAGLSGCPLFSDRSRTK